jgi:hypothetical protein
MNRYNVSSFKVLKSIDHYLLSGVCFSSCIIIEGKFKDCVVSSFRNAQAFVSRCKLFDRIETNSLLVIPVKSRRTHYPYLTEISK